MSLKAFRDSRELSQAAAAEQLGVTQPTFLRWETGINLPGRAAMLRIRTWSGGLVTPNDFHGCAPATDEGADPTSARRESHDSAATLEHAA